MPTPLPSRLRLLVFGAVLWSLVPANAALAQDPAPVAREALLRLVPDDVALCLLVTDLRTQGDKLMKSPWVKALKDAPFAKALGDAPELLKLTELRKQIQKHLQIDWNQLRDEILGDAVVFAYRPALPGQAEKEACLLLLHARNPGLLKLLIDRLNQDQKRTGDLKDLKIREYKGLAYFERVEARGSQFYMLEGNQLAISGQKGMFERMLDRRADPKAQALPVLRQLGEAGCYKALASLWINPRAFDVTLEAQAAELGETAEGKSLRSFLTYWKALEGVSLSVLVEKNPELVLSLHARSDRLPAAARKLVTGSAKPSEVWEYIPADSAVAVAGRTDFEALLQTLDELAPGDAEEGMTDLMQKSLGLPINKELLRALASKIGPDWGFSVAAPSNKDEFPHVLFAVKQRTEAGGPDLTQSLHLLAKVAIGQYNRNNKDQIKIHVAKHDGVDVRYLVNDAKFPKGFQPAFAARDGYLLLGSSPGALERFRKTGVPPPPGGGTPLARISFKELSMLLKDRRAKVVDFLGQKRQLTPQAAGKHFENLTWALDLFDTAELVQRSDGERVAWIFRLRTAEPPK